MCTTRTCAHVAVVLDLAGNVGIHICTYTNAYHARTRARTHTNLAELSNVGQQFLHDFKVPTGHLICVCERVQNNFRCWSALCRRLQFAGFHIYIYYLCLFVCICMHVCMCLCIYEQKYMCACAYNIYIYIYIYIYIKITHTHTHTHTSQEEEEISRMPETNLPSVTFDVLPSIRP